MEVGERDCGVLVGRSFFYREFLIMIFFFCRGFVNLDFFSSKVGGVEAVVGGSFLGFLEGL